MSVLLIKLSDDPAAGRVPVVSFQANNRGRHGPDSKPRARLHRAQGHRCDGSETFRPVTAAARGLSHGLRPPPSRTLQPIQAQDSRCSHKSCLRTLFADPGNAPRVGTKASEHRTLTISARFARYSWLDQMSPVVGLPSHISARASMSRPWRLLLVSVTLCVPRSNAPLTRKSVRRLARRFGCAHVNRQDRTRNM